MQWKSNDKEKADHHAATGLEGGNSPSGPAWSCALPRSDQSLRLQIIVGADSKQMFVVVLYEKLSRMKSGSTSGTVPHEVVNLSFERGASPMAAWREHLGLTQADVAARIGITQAAYAQMERAKQPRKATLQKVAEAMELELEQLRW